MPAFEAIFCHDDLPLGLVARIEVSTPGAAQDVANENISDPESVFYQCTFTIWPDPVQ